LFDFHNDFILIVKSFKLCAVQDVSERNLEDVFLYVDYISFAQQRSNAPILDF